MSLALIFPGQGAQEPGMGKGLFDRGSPCHEIALEASEIAGLDLVQLACEGTAEDVRATEVAQPLLLLHSVALLREVPRAVVDSAVGFAGHSLGEYSGLVATGSLGWQAALALVRQRGLAMAAASSPDQAMAAVLALTEEEVEEVLAKHPGEGTAVIANLNAPGQVVVSGHRARLDGLADAFKAAGARRTLPLTVAGAFHSPLMAAAAVGLGEAIAAAPFTEGRPQAFNVDGRVRTAPEQVAAALRAQLTGAVRWVECIDSLVRLGADRFLELGPGGTLAALGRRIVPAATWVSAGSAAAARAVA